jgi:hypothetical protein
MFHMKQIIDFAYRLTIATGVFTLIVALLTVALMSLWGPIEWR